jgi:hypothetical protein
MVAATHPQQLRICKCNICICENMFLRNRDVVAYHLSQYGRAPFLRGSTTVSSLSACNLNHTYITRAEFLYFFNIPLCAQIHHRDFQVTTQQAFHVYDDAGAGEDPLAREANAERVDVDSHLEGALDTESLSMDDDDNLPNPHSGA